MTEKERLDDNIDWLIMAIAHHYTYIKEHPPEETFGFRLKTGGLTDTDMELVKKVVGRIGDILDNWLYIGEDEMQKYKRTKLNPKQKLMVDALDALGGVKL